jgi:predicted dehydrogenase
MGLQHAAILSVLTGRKVCVHDSNERLRGIAKVAANNLCVHSNIHDLLQEKNLGAVFICTPVQTHKELIRLVVGDTSKDIGLFVEKPLSTDFESARELAAYSISNSRRVMVGFQKRFNGVYSKLKDMIERGVLGDIKFYTSHSFSYDVQRKSEGWKFECPYGGVTLDYGAHLLDLLIWLFGEPEVSSSFSRMMFSRAVEDYVHATLNHGGVLGTISIGWSMRNYAPNDHTLEVHGTNGTAVATDEHLIVYLDKSTFDAYPQGVHTYPASQLTPKPPYLLTYPEYVLEDQYFLNHVASGIMLEPDFRQAARVNKLADSIRKQTKVF